MRMTFKLNSLAKGGLLVAASIVSFDSQAINYEQDINNVYDLLRFQSQTRNMNDKSRNGLVEQQMRLKLIEDFARQSAIKAAMIATNKQINNIIQTDSRQLDAIYNFNALMIQGKVVPPVISEANDLYNQKGTDQIRLTKRVYNIEKQASFSSTAPNWRSYLNVNYEADAFDKISFMGGDLSPRNEEEKRVWEKATVDGWNIGVNEAGIALQQKLERLNRDYIGMIKFHLLAMQGRITMPAISSYNLYDKNTGIQWSIDEKLLRIDTLPQFKQVGANEILSSYESGVVVRQPTGGTSIVLNETPAAQKINQSLTNSNNVDSNNIVNARPTDFNKNNQSIPPLNTIEVSKGLVFNNQSATAPSDVNTQPISNSAPIKKPKQKATSKKSKTSYRTNNNTAQQVTPSFATPVMNTPTAKGADQTILLHGYINRSLPDQSANVIKPLPTIASNKSDSRETVSKTFEKVNKQEDIAPKPSLSPLDYVKNPYAPTQNLVINNTVTYQVKQEDVVKQ